MNKQGVGKKGEEAAASYLAARGYKILERNFRCRMGELDLIAEESGQVVFVEVRARSSTAFGLPEESVGPEKRKRLRRLASFYLLQRGRGEADCRFDVVAVLLDDGGQVQKTTHYRGAF